MEFGRDIEPILARACTSCHGPDKQRGGLRLDGKATALRGGDSGPVIVPGASHSSPLIERLVSTDPAERMPLRGEPLTAAQVGLLRAWIDAGAAWPDGVVGAAGPPDWWSFRPLRRSPVPHLSGEAGRWVRSPIDAFIVAGMAAQGLTPSPEADRRTLIRRLSFDLVGLPPTPEAVAAFVADPDPLAYEALVERLLASPRHGERWAQHWLDVVRYGDTHGFEVNTPRPNAWPYRDWVIRALNADKPYTRFVLEQLAGDALGADAATGFLVAGPALLAAQVGKDVASRRQARQDELHETLSSTSTTFLGLTAGCARCHSHKFDPIPQGDYYALQAVFAGLHYGERPLNDGELESRVRQREPLLAELREVELALDEHEPLASESSVPRRTPVRPARNVDRFEPTDARFVRFTIAGTNDGTEPCLDELEVFTAESTPCNVALTSSGAGSQASSTRPKSEIHRLAHLNDGRYGNGRSWISGERGKGWVTIELPAPARIDRVVWGRDREGRYKDRLAVAYRIEVATDTEPDQWRLVASSKDRTPDGAEPQAGTAFAPRDEPAHRRLLQRQAELNRLLAGLPVESRAFAGVFERPEPTFRLHRGDAMQPLEAVAPDAFSALREPLGSLALAADAPEPERRLALARWIVRPDNPLTPRVLVNRLWQYHFGTGLVDTPSDFGRNGSRPTHPELLDDLALRFVESGWSLKAVHRLIVVSATYRQASAPRAEAARSDAQSRLLCYPPRRLEAEVIRDSILHTSGMLDLRMGGPGFLVFKANSNYVRVYEPKDEWEPSDWRRMVYMHKVRMAQDGVFGVFDCPDAGQPAPRRSRSTTALQALSLFNSTFILQQAELFARRVEQEAGPDTAVQVEHAFRLGLHRDPTVGERDESTQVARQFGLALVCRVLFNTNEFLFLP